MTPDPRLAALRALAEKATTGPWYAADRSLCVRTGDWPKNAHPCGTARPVAVCHDPDDAFRDSVGMGSRADDCAFIAAANPAVVLSLLDALAAAEENRDHWRAKEASTYERYATLTHDAVKLMQERDALAARLAGAMRVVEAVRSRRMEVPPLVYGAFDEWRREFDNASEAGGEGRGT